MSVEENIEVVRRFGEALTHRDWTAFDHFIRQTMTQQLGLD